MNNLTSILRSIANIQTEMFNLILKCERLTESPDKMIISAHIMYLHICGVFYEYIIKNQPDMDIDLVHTTITNKLVYDFHNNVSNVYAIIFSSNTRENKQQQEERTTNFRELMNRAIALARSSAPGVGAVYPFDKIADLEKFIQDQPETEMYCGCFNYFKTGNGSGQSSVNYLAEFYHDLIKSNELKEGAFKWYSDDTHGTIRVSNTLKNLEKIYPLDNYSMIRMMYTMFNHKKHNKFHDTKEECKAILIKDSDLKDLENGIDKYGVCNEFFRNSLIDGIRITTNVFKNAMITINTILEDPKEPVHVVDFGTYIDFISTIMSSGVDQTNNTSIPMDIDSADCETHANTNPPIEKILQERPLDEVIEPPHKKQKISESDSEQILVIQRSYIKNIVNQFIADIIKKDPLTIHRDYLAQKAMNKVFIQHDIDWEFVETQERILPVKSGR